MDLDYYNSQLNAMRSANTGIKFPPVVDDIVNDRAVVGKSALEGVSTNLVGGATVKSLSALSKSKTLKKIGIESKDVDSVIARASEGDLKGVASNTADAIVRAGNRALQTGIKSGVERLNTLGSTAIKRFRPAIPEFEEAFKGTALENIRPEPLPTRPPPAEPQALPPNPQEEPDIRPAEIQSNQEYATQLKQNVQQTLSRGVDEDPFSNPVPLGQTIEKVDEGVSTGEKVLKDLSEATKVSEVADAFDPVDIAITATLGLAGVVGGLFVKTHHTNYIQPPQQTPTNYGSQLL